MQKVAVIVPARLKSERIPNKPLATINNRTLIEMATSKLSHLSSEIVHDCFTSFSPDDLELMECGRLYNIDNIDLTPEQAAGGWVEMSSGWKTLNYDWLIVLNLVCHPFLRVDTLCRIIRVLQDYPTPAVVVKKKRGHIWNERKVLTNYDASGPLDTKHSPVYYESAHVADCYTPSDCGLADGRVSRPYPVHVAVDPIEMLDIDTELDLELARRIR